MEGVYEYFAAKREKATELIKKLQLIQMRGVKDLSNARTYFKYIVQEKRNSLYDDLDEYLATENKLASESKRFRLELAGQLNNYIWTHEYIPHEHGQLSSDFEDYIQLACTTDPDLRVVLQQKFH